MSNKKDEDYGGGSGRSEYKKGRFLTDGDRKYLEGEEPESDGAERQSKYRIRQRTVGALRDLGLVAREIDADDREAIYEFSHPEDLSEYTEMPDGTRIPYPGDEDTPLDVWGNLGMSHELKAILQLWYKTFRERGFSRGHMESLIGWALARAEKDLRRGRKDVEVTLEIETVDDVNLKAARMRFENDKELSPMDLKALVEAGYVNLEPTG